MIDADEMAPFMGFTEEEVNGLSLKAGMDYEEIKQGIILKVWIYTHLSLSLQH